MAPAGALATALTPASAAPAVGAPGSSGSSATPGSAFHSPELTSGLLSDHPEPWQREDLGRLSRLLGMNPREVLDALRSGGGLRFLLAARRLTFAILHGRFDKGLLIDAQA